MLSICNVNNIDRDIAETGLIELSIKVQDHGTPPLSSTTVLIVNVKGVNDNSPVFVHQSKTYSIKEGETKGNFHIAMVR